MGGGVSSQRHRERASPRLQKAQAGSKTNFGLRLPATASPSGAETQGQVPASHLPSALTAEEEISSVPKKSRVTMLHPAEISSSGVSDISQS